MRHEHFDNIEFAEQRIQALRACHFHAYLTKAANGWCVCIYTD